MAGGIYFLRLFPTAVHGRPSIHQLVMKLLVVITKENLDTAVDSAVIFMDAEQ